MEDVSTRASLDALSEMALTINSISQPDELIEKVLQIAMETLDAERGFVLLTAPDSADGFEVAHRKNFTHEEAGSIARISTSVVNEVLRNNEPVLIYEAQGHEQYGGMESIILQKIQSIACVPLRVKEKQVGAVYLDSLSKRGRFTRENLPFLEAFANQSAIAIENAKLYETLRDENRLLRTEMQRLHRFDNILGQSATMRDVFEVMSRVAQSDATVVIGGESGTGKELVARALHYNSQRAAKPFVAIFCGSLPDDLLESELFGHKKGAFTGATADKKGLFESADGGSVFLDEIGDLSQRLQLALLRVLQEREIRRVGENTVRKVNVRLISASNKPLRQLVTDGTFREDLFYRLNTISIDLPPLRHRRGDVALLAHHFVDKFAERNQKEIKGFTKEAMAAMQAYTWPGNVRELENAVERAVVLSRTELIGVDDLQLPTVPEGNHVPIGLTLKEAERVFVQKTLEDCEGNISETARVLGVSRRWLHYKLKEWAPESE